MGYVVLEGREPFDLVAQRLPSAVAVNGLVAATVPIYSPRFPSNTADVRILLNPEQAEDLARQLLLEAKNASERYEICASALGDLVAPNLHGLARLTNASDFDPMVKIAISRAAYAVIASALPGSSLRVEPQPCRRAYVRWLVPKMPAWPPAKPEAGDGRASWTESNRKWGRRKSSSSTWRPLSLDCSNNTTSISASSTGLRTTKRGSEANARRTRRSQRLRALGHSSSNSSFATSTK